MQGFLPFLHAVWNQEERTCPRLIANVIPRFLNCGEVKLICDWARWEESVRAVLTLGVLPATHRLQNGIFVRGFAKYRGCGMEVLKTGQMRINRPLQPDGKTRKFASLRARTMGQGSIFLDSFWCLISNILEPYSNAVEDFLCQNYWCNFVVVSRGNKYPHPCIDLDFGWTS